MIDADIDWIRHDRSRRFMRSVFSWNTPPEDDLLMNGASNIRVLLRAGRNRRDSWSEQLLLLVTANVLLRLPVHVDIQIPNSPLIAAVSPYAGDDLHAALRMLADDLGVEPGLESRKGPSGVSLVIEAADDVIEVHLAASGWRLLLSASDPPALSNGNAVSIHAAASAGIAEVVRAWARATAALGAKVGPRFEMDCAPTGPCLINMWKPGSEQDGPEIGDLRLPHTDWVGAGAITQAALAVLAAIPGISMTGRIFDPKDLDAPDLNRSVLSFLADVGGRKAEIVVERLGSGVSAFESRPETYPPHEDRCSAWIACGADNLAARSRSQEAWPEYVVVGATEHGFAQALWHGTGSSGPCVACFSEASFPEDPVPTIGATSLFGGALCAATLCRLALGAAPAPRVDALTLRLDSPIGVDATHPRPNPDCHVCGPKREKAAHSQ